MSVSLVSQILALGAAQAEGTILSAKGLLHLGSRAAVDQALSRLTRSGRLLRVGRGWYVMPVRTRFGVRSPDLGKVVSAVAALRGEVTVPSGAAEANALGLTTQVPTRMIFLTSGRSRWLQLGNQAVELRHAPAWQLRGPARAIVRALAACGPAEAPRALQRLRDTLSPPEREALVATRAGLPTWLAASISETFCRPECVTRS